jgi:hypothetical protein
VPRRPVSIAVKSQILTEQGYRCANCGNPINVGSVAKFDPDHRVPRLRGGGNERENLQSLCSACNNNKSSQCSNCNVECQTCPWAYPETYRAPLLRPDVIARLNENARARNMDVSVYADELLKRALRE